MKTEYEIRDLIEKMNTKNGSEYQRQLSELLAIGGPAIPILTHATRNRFSDIKIVSQVILPQFGEKAVPYILDEIARLDRSDSDGWRALWSVLENISFRSDLFPFLRKLENHENAFSRATLAIFIESKADIRGFDILIKYLDDDDMGVQKISAAGLGKLGDARALPKLYAWKELYKSSSIPYWDYVSVADEAISQISERK